MTTRTTIAILTLALGLAQPAGAAVSAKLAAESRLWLEGKSTLHPYSSAASSFDLTLALEPAKTAAQTLASGIESQSAASMSLKVAVAALKSEHKALDGNLQKALKAGQFPDIVFTMTGYRVDADSGTTMVVAWGDLTIAGVKKPQTLNAAFSRRGDRVVLDGQQPLLMTDFGVKPPTMMLGAIKTEDRVVVKFHLELEQAVVGQKGDR